MKYLITFVIGVSFLFSCGNIVINNHSISKEQEDKSYVDQKRVLAAFTKLNVLISCEVHVYPSTETYAIVHTSETNQAKIELEQQDDNLAITLNKKYSNLSGKVVIELYTPSIAFVNLLSSADVHITNFKDLQHLQTLVSGSGDIFLKSLSNIKSLKCVVNGSGDITADGELFTDDCSFTVSGSGDIKAKSVQAKNLKVSINGSGDIECSVVESISVVINGSGDVHYFGNPKERSVVINGSGEVKVN